MTHALSVALLSGATDIAAAEWDVCAGTANPFVRHAFLSSLEDSGSAVVETGWQPLHLACRDADDQLLGLLPAYAKSHSMGEYVFDHAWADAFERAGGRYYPKLQIAVPFTPATGPRLLLANPIAATPLITAAENLCRNNGLSSAHATFVAPDQVALFESAGWLIRHDIQFHWSNRGYSTYADFLADLSARKRKALRKERQDLQAAGIDILTLTGRDLNESHWDAFWRFYQDTSARKWGRPYLTRSFFSMIDERMADAIVMVLALRGRRPIAGALNFVGSDTLYGRYWGCSEDVPGLHFELCYHRAIDFAIAHGLSQVEAGAQGPHKLARGYLPVITRSAHWIGHPSLKAAISDFLVRERSLMAEQLKLLMRDSPFRQSDNG